MPQRTTTNNDEIEKACDKLRRELRNLSQEFYGDVTMRVVVQQGSVIGFDFMPVEKYRTGRQDGSSLTTRR